MDQVLSHRLIRSAPSTDLGKGPATKLDEFSGKFQTASTSPLIFGQLYWEFSILDALQKFAVPHMVAYANW